MQPGVQPACHPGLWQVSLRADRAGEGGPSGGRQPRLFMGWVASADQNVLKRSAELCSQTAEVVVSKGSPARKSWLWAGTLYQRTSRSFQAQVSCRH